MKIIANLDIEGELIEALRSDGHDVVAVREQPQTGSPHAVWRNAGIERRTLLTYDERLARHELRLARMLLQFGGASLPAKVKRILEVVRWMNPAKGECFNVTLNGMNSDTCQTEMRLVPCMLVKDVISTVEYYTKKLGFHLDVSRSNPPEESRVVDGFETKLEFVFKKSAGNQQVGGSPVEFEIWKDDVDESFEHYKKNGVKITFAPQTFDGVRRFGFEDCNGFRFVVSQEVHTS